jgi:solute carrier family 4 (sodium borate transporter), member 11
VQKGTKNVLETGRTFATLFADTDLRIRLLNARSETEFKRLMWEQMKELADEQQQGSLSHRRQGSESSSEEKEDESPPTVSAKTCAS